jgi:hypothetical protein
MLLWERLVVALFLIPVIAYSLFSLHFFASLQQA